MQVFGQDGVAYTQQSFTTTATGMSFRGPVPSGAVGIQVSIRGGSWQDSPDLVDFGTTDWISPATGVVPLNHGSNEFRFRPVMADGSVGSQAVAQVWRMPQTVARRDPPLSIQANRTTEGVEILVDVPDDGDVRGVYLYGSTATGGPYSRLNRAPISDYVVREELISLADLTVQQELLRNPDLSLVADPTYLRFNLQQETLAGSATSLDLNDRLEFADDVASYRVELAVTQVITRNTARFVHKRNGTSADNHLANSQIAGLPDDQPVYYVATLIYFDGVTEQESSFTPEIASRPLTVPALSIYPAVSRQQILEDQISLTLAQQPGLSVTPGSVPRDLYLDPFSTEAARIRFLVDFLHRCGSFDTLLEIDDPFGTGSVDVSRSTYKQALRQALFLQSDQAVQDVIDQAFDRLAARLGVVRSTGSYAIGLVTFWTSTRPQSTITIPVGSVVVAGGLNFRTLANAVIDANQVATAYNPLTGRYSVTVSARADQPGSAGNLAPGQVQTLVPSVPTVSVTNNGYFSGGSDIQTNRQLAGIAQQALSGTDTGTLAGIGRWVSKQSGVSQYLVVGSGDPLMSRGTGKVDIWVRGSDSQVLTDTFAMPYGTRRGVVFEPLDDTGLLWQAQDTTLSTSQSFVEFLSGSNGIGLRNVTRGLAFDLTGATVVDYRTVRLADVVQPSVAVTDVVLGDFRVRQTDRYTLARQPVLEVVSTVGTVQGSVATTLLHPDDPQQLGRSNQSHDVVILTDAGSYEDVSEQHVLVSESREYLDHLGADVLSLVVTNLDDTLTYSGPRQGNPDYLVGEGTARSPAWISRVAGGLIADGQEVLVSYRAAENFVVSYRTPTIVERVASAVAANKHITADIAVKASPEMRLDLTCTVRPNAGVENVTGISQDIATGISTLLADLPLGGTVDPSDVVEVIKSQTGVRSVVLPLTRMAAGDGSTVLMESLLSDAVAISTWSTDQQVVWLLTDPLDYATPQGGGDFAAVYQNNQPLSFGTLGSLVAGQAIILAPEGAVLPGYSDDVTLAAALPASAGQVEIAALRRTLTGNRVLVALNPLTPAPSQAWNVSYTVSGDQGSRELTCGPFGYWTVGQVSVTFDRG